MPYAINRAEALETSASEAGGKLTLQSGALRQGAWLRRMGPGGEKMSELKETTWDGYFHCYRRAAHERGLTPQELLDEQWADGRETAETSVLPHLTPKSDVLEIACGLGRVSRFVAPHCRSLCCTDILDDALEGCQESLAGASNVRFVKTNGYDLVEFADGSFDCVYSFTAFFHLDWEVVVGYFAEIRRVLRRGGTAILEFKQWRRTADVEQLIAKIEKVGGVAAYESQLEKWRYVSPDMLDLLCDYFDLVPIDRDATHYTCRKS